MRDVIDNIEREGYHITMGESKSAPDRLLTAQEVSELLSVKKSYVYFLTHSKKIPHIKIEGLLRFRRSQIEAWLSNMEVRNDVSS